MSTFDDSLPPNNPTQKQRKEWRCTNPFMNMLRRQNIKVEVCLKNGMKLVGHIREYDEEGIVFHGGLDERKATTQLLMMGAIASIGPRKEESGGQLREA